MKTIDQLIADKKKTTAPEAQVQTTRFMLVLDNATRDSLRDLCDTLGQPQIKFASELFTLALNQAIDAAKK